MGISFKQTGAKLRDGVIPAGTTVWKRVLEDADNRPYPQIIEMIALADGVIPHECRKQLAANKPCMINSAFRKFRKCRVPAVYVVSGEGISHGGNAAVKYTPGQIVRADIYNPDPNKVCTGGIHVFLTRAEAEAYNWT